MDMSQNDALIAKIEASAITNMNKIQQQSQCPSKETSTIYFEKVPELALCRNANWKNILKELNLTKE